MERFFYRDTIRGFLDENPKAILGELTGNNPFPLLATQRNAWTAEISILKDTLKGFEGEVLFEYSIPRMGRRVDVIVIIKSVIFVLEFKVGSDCFEVADVDQVWDYSLDLKNFHEGSHFHYVAPVLIASEAGDGFPVVSLTPHNDRSLFPIRCNKHTLKDAIIAVLQFVDDSEPIDPSAWVSSRYRPTPTIIEAAMALYNNHTVKDISRSDAGAINLDRTSDTIKDIIKASREKSLKSICFVTGVPGAGKTLVGLNIATTHYDKESDLYSVFLSGNGPLVAVLREALVRDKVSRERERGRGLTKKEASSEVKMFIQNVHNFRDECLFDRRRPPVEHVALFDEAQRAWDKEQTVNFMKRKKKVPNFDVSEPEFLISCLDRHEDWAVIVCLVGGGQEINTGEAGIGEWIRVLQKSFPHWNVLISNRLTDSEYGAGALLETLGARSNVRYIDELHLSVSMRSFRAENISLLVKELLDCEREKASRTLRGIKDYPMAITRDLAGAKNWLKQKARGSERYGIVVSSQAERLKPHAVDVRTPVNPVQWFLNGKEDVRSSYYLEDVATEFHVQGLELDWACVIWDADFRYARNSWTYKSFRGSKWTSILKQERKTYLKNAYRVLLTRARQGMVIVVPPGDEEDPTRNPAFYNPTYEYLKSVGFEEI